MKQNKKYTAQEAYEKIDKEIEKKMPKNPWFDVNQSKEYLRVTLDYQERYQGGLDDIECELIIKYHWQAFFDKGEVFMDVCDELGIQNKVEAMSFLKLRNDGSDDYAELTYLLKKYKRLGGE